MTMSGPEAIRDAIAHPERYETWRLDVLRSDANWHRMYDEEDALREIVRTRRGW
jgi:hypothetical protein